MGQEDLVSAEVQTFKQEGHWEERKGSMGHNGQSNPNDDIIGEDSCIVKRVGDGHKAVK